MTVLRTHVQGYRRRLGSLSLLLLILFDGAPGQTGTFDYKRQLFGQPPTLSPSIQSINAGTGGVVVNGSDSRAPSTPFTWHWGDGNVSNGFFPQSHAYANTDTNYVVRVIATYSDGTKDTSSVLVRFAPPEINPIPLHSSFTVIVPETKPTLGTRLYALPSQLTAFDEGFFSILSRETLEYVLSICAMVQEEFSNGEVFRLDGKFTQIMLRDSTFGGAYSLWFTDPVSFGVGESFLQGSIGYSSLFHEMGHNFTLNMPGSFYYGGRIDGNANAIYSECLANIYAHATAFQIVNNYESYGLSPDLTYEIMKSAVSSVGVIRSAYDRYVTLGKPFSSWNDPNTPQDETFDTFMTLAFKFLEKAETLGQGFSAPLQRTSRLLQGFNANWAQRYDRHNDNPAADTFRATLLVTAISYGFSTDMRSEFRDLNFPISDSIYFELYNSVTSIERYNDSGLPTLELRQNYPNPFNPSTEIQFSVPGKSHVNLRVFNLLGQEVATIFSGDLPAGSFRVGWDAGKFTSGTYLYRLEAGEMAKSKKLMLLH